MDEDPGAALAQLSTALDGIEAGLASLFSIPLDETRGALSPLDRAKLDVFLAYTINDLIWMFLRTKGVEPDSHDVAPELERIKTYYAKIKDVESPAARIDKAAARRLVTASIPRSQRFPPATSGAALALAQAETAAAAADDGPGMPDRFRFVQADEESVVPGSGGSGGMEVVEGEDGEEDGSGDGEEDGGVDGVDGGGGGGDGQGGAAGADEAEAFLAGVQDALEPSPAAAPAKKSKKGGAKRAKRKRAEDLNG